MSEKLSSTIELPPPHPEADVQALPEVAQPSYEAVDYLIQTHEEAVRKGRNELADNLGRFLEESPELLLGDNWVAQRLAGFIEGVKAYEADSTLEFHAPWFDLKAGETDLGTKLAGTEIVLDVLGFTPQAKSPDTDIIGYDSELFPRISVARIVSEGGKQLSYVVGTKPSTTAAA